MRNNSLYNINQNKRLEDKLSNQVTNQSKITRPSDDPVVAIRALRLRSNVTTISQYYDKNALDASSWISLTADAMKTVGEVLDSLYEQATTASDKYLTAADMSIILEQMNALTKEFYASGNVDYAGRYIFSGFRTDTPITFTAENEKEFNKDPNNRKTYVIEEKLGYSDISSFTYTDWKDSSNSQGVKENELGIENTTLYRFRLSYEELDDEVRFLNPDGTVGTESPIQINVGGAGSMILPPAANANVTQYADVEEAYKAIAYNNKNGDGSAVAYVPSTGEIIFGEKYYQDPLKVNENMNVTVKYAKSEWKEGDIDPVHYFHAIACDESTAKKAMDLEKAKGDLEVAQANLKLVESSAGSTWQDIQNARADVEAAQEVVDDIMGVVIEYNFDGEDQDIYYDVGFNQTIQVNSHSDEIFSHDARRDMDDFKIYLKQLQDVEAVIKDVETKMASFAEDSQEYKDLKLQLDAANKAYTYIRDNVQTKFENQISKYQSYIDNTNIAVTNNGTRGSRLDLITSRLMNQKATFKDLQSNNEDIDVTEVAVQLKSSELTYEAALMATSKIMQTNLMNYI